MESVQYVLATEYSCTLLYYCLHKRRGSSTVASTGGGDETICLLEEASRSKPDWAEIDAWIQFV